MEKTKAAFRALREECGFTQQEIADEFGVRLLTVKKWEKPHSDISAPPDDVWQWLLECRGALHQDAREIAEQIMESLESFPNGIQKLELDYYRTQEALDNVQLGTGTDEPVGYVNARTRLVGQLLDRAEVPYTYRYQGE